MDRKKQKPRRQKHVAQRTCIACRQQFDKRRLTRIVRTPDAGVQVDATGKRNGRGAYLCDQPACWDRVVQNVTLLNKALRTEVSETDKMTIATHKPVAIHNSGETAQP